MFKTGNIPENLTFFRKPAEVITTGWDDLDDVNIGKATVYPAYVSDAADLQPKVRN